MKTFVLPLAAATLLAACDPQSLGFLSGEIQDAQSVCPAATPGNCAFVNSPVATQSDPIVLPKRPYPFFKTANDLSFFDALGRSWAAPRNTLTDGASIPPIFVSIVGNPREPQFANAAAIHDAYCGVGNEQGPVYHDGKWQDVHRMFYDALIAGGTPQPRAGLMFAAVYLGGPRWNIAYDQDLTQVPAPAKQQAMRRVKSFIEREEPSFSRLLLRLKQEERFLLSTELLREEDPEKDRSAGAADPGGDGTGGDYGDDPYGDDGVDPTVGETDPALGDPTEGTESTETSILLLQSSL